MPTELERIMADACELVEARLKTNQTAKADLKRLLDAGNSPWVVTPVNVPFAVEIFVELRNPLA